MKTITKKSHSLPLTHNRPAPADESWLDMLLGVMDPTLKSIRVQK